MSLNQKSTMKARNGRTVVVEKVVRPPFPSSTAASAAKVMVEQDELTDDAKVQAFLAANPIAAYLLKHSKGLRRVLKTIKEPPKEALVLIEALDLYIPVQREFVKKASK